MEHYAGIDVSLERSSVCVVDATGRIIRETKVASEPEAAAAATAPSAVKRSPGRPRKAITAPSAAGSASPSPQGSRG